MDRTERFYKIEMLIRNRGLVSFAALQAELELSRATLQRDLLYLREQMGKAVRDLLPFDEAYAAVDWSRFEKVPAFAAANRINAYGTYLGLEQEALRK